ncbi:hypothetical protein AAOGI_32680 [Agarivorans albus]
MSALPVTQIFPDLLASLSNKQQFIVCAPPGAGKSTALPLMLLQQAKLKGKIILLEPRRLAARNIAEFLASQLGESVGERVGYQMRGDKRHSSQTQLLVVTEGILTRLIQQDPELDGVAMVIFDEFHVLLRVTFVAKSYQISIWLFLFVSSECLITSFCAVSDFLPIQL